MKAKAILLRSLFITLVLCVVLGVCFASCSPETITPKPAGVKYGGTLRIADQYEGNNSGYPAKMLPMASSRQAGASIESLFRSDKAGNVIPWLATGYKTDINNKTLTISLRQGVKFHDGTDFNADAAKWNLEQYVASKTAGFDKFKSVDIIDDFTVRINLTDWDSTILTNFAYSTGVMISPTACKANGADWAAKNPVGTGPFQFVSWQKDVLSKFKKFNNYWQKGKPYLDAIEHRPIVNSTTRLMSFQSKEQDVILTLDSKDIASLEKNGYTVMRQNPGSGTYSMVPDSANTNSPWANLKVRQAAQSAINTEAISKAIFYSEYLPANQWTFKGHWAYNDSITGYPYNPEKAKQLLKEAGYPIGFKTKVIYISSPQMDQMYASIQAFFKVVGIDLELDAAQQAKVNQIYTGATWEGLANGSITGNPDVAGALVARYTGKSYVNMLKPDDYVQALNKAIVATSAEEKQKYTQETMKLMIDKYCLRVVLVCPVDLGATQKNVHNTGFLSNPNTAWWTPEDAWLDQ